MSNDDDFTPELGKPRAGGSRRGRTYLQRILQARMLAGGSRRTGRSFNGTRIARGTVAGRQLASRDRFAGFRQRRVMVKYRIAKFNKANSMGAARAHLRYIQRDGVTREGEPGQVYSAEHDRAVSGG